jgi:hypothetical protein
LGNRLQSQAGLPNPSGPYQRQETAGRVVEKLFNLGKFLLTADERGRLRRKVVGKSVGELRHPGKGFGTLVLLGKVQDVGHEFTFDFRF